MGISPPNTPTRGSLPAGVWGSVPRFQFPKTPKVAAKAIRAAVLAKQMKKRKATAFEKNKAVAFFGLSALAAVFLYEEVMLLIQIIAGIFQRFANTVNMKWILKEPPTAFLNDIFQYAHHFCAYLKVPWLLPYSLIYEVMRLFFTDFQHSSLFSKAKSPPVNRFLI